MAGLVFTEIYKTVKKSRFGGNNQKSKVGHVKIGMPFGHESGEVEETMGYMVWSLEERSRPEIYL